MLVKRRRAAINLPPMRSPFRRRVDNHTIELLSKGTDITRSIGLDSRDLLSTSFLQICRNILYSVVPEDDETSDISNGTRQMWDDIMSLLIHCGLIKKQHEKQWIRRYFAEMARILSDVLTPDQNAFWRL